MTKQDSFLLDVTVKDIWFGRLVNSEGLIQTTAKGVKIHSEQRKICECAYWSRLIRDTILRAGNQWGADHCTGNRKQQSEQYD